MARRMPISRVRSVTDTSMMFMMPMPPTNREIAAMPVTTAVRVPVTLPRVSASCLVSRIEKLSVLPGRMLRRSRSSWVMESWIGPESKRGSTATTMFCTFWLPVKRRWTVRYGITTVLSWSPPRPLWPRFFSRPITSQLMLPTLSVVPTGSSSG